MKVLFRIYSSLIRFPKKGRTTKITITPTEPLLVLYLDLCVLLNMSLNMFYMG